MLRLDFDQLFFDCFCHLRVGLNYVKAVGQADNERCPVIAHVGDVLGDRYFKTVLYPVTLLDLFVEAFAKNSTLL